MVQFNNNSKFALMADEINIYLKDIENKVILEVGCDSKGELIQYISKIHKPNEIIGLNMVVNSEKLNENTWLKKGDIRKTDFPDNYFDYIYSLAAFEHVFDLNIALNEMYRILKPGGLLYTKFGPIWSSCWGHHLWLNHKSSVYNYINTELPPYCHLLMTPNELNKVISGRFEKEICEKIVEYVFNCPDQNRLFYEDYEEIVNKSQFQNLIFYASVNYPLKNGYHPDNYADMLESLQKKYPDYKKFYYQVIYLLLKKQNA